LKLDDNDAWVKNNIPEAIIMIMNNSNKYSIEINLYYPYFLIILGINKVCFN